MVHSTLKLATAFSVCALIGCTSAPYDRSADLTYGPPAYAHYHGADRIFARDYVDATRPRGPAYVAQKGPNADLLDRFRGIDGARLAHDLYPKVYAEMLDGDCERFVNIERGETLYDIEELCDVPVRTLIAYNPALRNVRHTRPGNRLEIPQLPNPDRAALQYDANDLLHAAYYVAQPGDTLEGVAAKHLVSASALANLNPEIDWNRLAVGARLRLPPAGSAAPAVVTPVSSNSLPYPYGGGVAGAGGGGSSGWPNYVLTPPGSAGGPQDRSLLTIDRTAVSPGQKVTVSAPAGALPPNADVTLCKGANSRDIAQKKSCETVRTDSAGAFETEVTVGGGDLGGVIFTAKAAGADKLQSPRVGVNTLDKN
jgi:LysM repeat protein